MKNKPVILLIYDDADDHEIFNMAMQGIALECETHYAFSAEQALQMLIPVTPDVIFVDMQMPRMNGMQFLTGLKNISNELPFEVVMFSTGMNKELCEEAIE